MQRFLFLLVGCSVLVAGVGCSENRTAPTPEAPKYGVKGKVVYRDGSPMPGGVIEFRSTKDPTVTTLGQIQADGTFTLISISDKQNSSGALEGPHTVTITPKLAGDQTAQPILEPITLPRPYTVKAEDQNDFTITIDRPKSRGK